MKEIISEFTTEIIDVPSQPVPPAIKILFIPLSDCICYVLQSNNQHFMTRLKKNAKKFPLYIAASIYNITHCHCMFYAG
jgi:hypothetical protein